MTEIAVIVVNYNAAELSLAAIESIRERHHGRHRVVVHLVDNASPEGDGERLADAAAARGWGDGVVLYRETVNHGFGRGNNLVLKQLAASTQPPEKVFLLNPDAALENEAIAVLADFLDRHPKAGAAGARIEKPGAIPVTSAFRFPSVIGEFTQHIAFGPVSRLCARWQVPLAPDLSTSRVDWVAGAAVMFRWEALAEAGFFDPAYFLYYEEVDLMRALDRHGWECWHIAEAHVTHVEGAATGVRSGEAVRRRRPAYWYHSWQYFFRKNHGRVYALTALAAGMLGVVLNHGIVRLRGRQPAAPLGFLRDNWAIAGRPLIGLEACLYD